VNRFRQGKTEKLETLGATFVAGAMPRRLARALDGADGNGA